VVAVKVKLKVEQAGDQKDCECQSGFDAFEH
jgi:hypothetical protein